MDPAYLTYLRQVGVSYLFAGKAQLDCPLLLEKLAARFGVQRLMVAGGGVDWSSLQAGWGRPGGPAPGPPMKTNVHPTAGAGRAPAQPAPRPPPFMGRPPPPRDGGGTPPRGRGRRHYEKGKRGPS